MLTAPLMLEDAADEGDGGDDSLLHVSIWCLTSFSGGFLILENKKLQKFPDAFITNCSGDVCGLKHSHKFDQAPLEN